MPVARNGDPDDEFYSEPTQYANYGGSGGQAYSELPEEQTAYTQPDYGYPTDYGHPADYGHAPAPEPATPWYRKPAPLVGLGALAAVILVLAVYAVVQLAGGSSSTTPTTTTAPNEPSASVAPGPAPDGTQTVTESPSATEAPAETTEAPSTTSEPATETTTAPPSVSTSTVTETQTVRPTRTFPTQLPTFFPRPGNGGSGGDGGGQ